MSLLPVTVPEGFKARFIADGWRGVERYYGARTALCRRWIADVGGLDALQAERKAHLRAMREGGRC